MSRQLLADVQNKNRDPLARFLQIMLQLVLLQTVGFTHEPLDAVAVDSLAEKAVAHTYPRLKMVLVILKDVKNPEWEMRELVPGSKYLLNGLSAFQTLLAAITVCDCGLRHKKAPAKNRGCKVSSTVRVQPRLQYYFFDPCSSETVSL